MRKPNPLQKLWRFFKAFTVGAAWLIGLLCFLVGLSNLGFPGAALLLFLGFFSCCCGSSISYSLYHEDLLKGQQVDEDESSDIPPGAV